MEQELRRLPDGTYTGAMTDEHICGIFGCCGDWNRREVRIGALTVYVYAIDGITSGGDASEYVVKPLMQDAFGGTMDELYDRALHRTVYNSVAVPCGDLQSTAEKLVNGFTVVLFGQRAIAFETKTGEKRSPSAPEVENTVKGPKDAFTETVRTNTSLLRRHLRTPALRLYETVVGQRSLTNVTLAWIDGLTEPALADEPQRERPALPPRRPREHGNGVPNPVDVSPGRLAGALDGLAARAGLPHGGHGAARRFRPPERPAPAGGGAPCHRPWHGGRRPCAGNNRRLRLHGPHPHVPWGGFFECGCGKRSRVLPAWAAIAPHRKGGFHDATVR